MRFISCNASHRACEIECSKDAEIRDLDADKLLKEFGQWGPYQMLGYYLCMMLTFFVSTSLFVMQFIQEVPDKDCYDVSDGRLLTQWYKNNETEKACELESGGIDGSFYCGERDTKLVYEHQQPIGSFIEEFELGCSHYIFREAGLSVSTIAAILCVPIVSHLSDVFGRKPILIIMVLIALIASILCCIAPYYWMFLAFRFIVGGVTDAYATIASILSCELVAQETRSWVGLVYTMAWVAGYLYVGLLSVFRLSWRWFYALAIAPMFISLLYFFWIPESPHWLATHGKFCELRKYIEDSMDFNNRRVDLSTCGVGSYRRLTRDNIKKNAEKGGDNQYLRALKKPMFIAFILINGYIQFITQLYYFALTFTSLSLSSDRFLGYMLSGFIEIPGGLIVIPLMNKFGRKSLAIASLLLQGLLIAGYPYAKDIEWLAITLNLLGKLANGIIQVVHPIIVTEMLPTKMRTMIYSVVNVPQSFGILLAPYVKYTSFGYEPLPFINLAVLSLIGMVLALFLPETKGKNLPEDVDEMDDGPLGNCFNPKSNQSLSDKRKCHTLE